MKMLLEQLSVHYDYIIIDTPPINLVTDALTLLPSIAGVLLVAKHAQSTYDAIEEAINAIKSLESSMPAKDNYSKGYDTALGRVQIAVRAVPPAADVMPVKYGKWEETHISLCKWIPEDEKEEGHSFYMAELKCSCCERYNAVTFVLTLNKPDFCQLCGARMDGDTE
jgi:hypothetical protein